MNEIIPIVYIIFDTVNRITYMVYAKEDIRAKCGHYSGTKP